MNTTYPAAARGTSRQIAHFTGNPRKSIFNCKDLDELVDAINALRNQKVVNGQIGQHLIGDRHSMLVAPGGVRSGAGALVRMFQINEDLPDDDLASIAADWIVCRSLSIAEDGTRTVGTTDVYIAKPFKLRNQIVTETIAGEQINYEYTTPTERIASLDSDPDTTETQVVVPYYLPQVRNEAAEILYAGDVIYASQVAGGTGVWREFEEDPSEQLQWLDLNVDGRAWAKKTE